METDTFSLRADFSQPAVVSPPGEADGPASPQPGVERWPLDRVGGGEILVLQGG